MHGFQNIISDTSFKKRPPLHEGDFFYTPSQGYDASFINVPDNGIWIPGSPEAHSATGKTDTFIAKYGPDVIEGTRGTTLFPSVKMGQMIIESGWGSGITAVKANNFFGIKADPSWKGAKMLFNTPRDAKPQNYFRVYNTPLDSIKDHTKFLLENSRYTKAGVFDAKTPEDQIRAIAKAGYAEAGKYDEAIIKLINAYHLKELDGRGGKGTPSSPTAPRFDIKWIWIGTGIALTITAAVLLATNSNKK